MIEPTTKREGELWNYWNSYLAKNGFSPGHMEAAKEFKIAVQTVHTLLLRMEKKGWMKRLNKTQRNWVPTTPKKDSKQEKYLGGLKIQFDKLNGNREANK